MKVLPSGHLVSSVVPSLVLLKAYDGTEDISGWLVSEKLDGVRAYWDGRRLISRSGREFAVPSWFTENFPPFELDGELWMGRGEFSKTVSIVQQHKPHNGWQDITYQVFELPNQQGGLLERLNILSLYLKAFPAPYLQGIEQSTISDNTSLQNLLQQVTEQGGEGLVLRNPDTLYYAGRTPNALKVKVKQDAECIVTGYTEGKGKYHGQVGALKCKLAKGTFPELSATEKRVIKLGSGLTDSQRLSPPKVGSVVTFQYMGVTQSGLPRFPVYLRAHSE
ncbi:MAG: DNA ligase [Gammaproteobacteria bacterium]|nr:DNA ligase [Gammaproteobacteria bacterium]